MSGRTGHRFAPAEGIGGDTPGEPVRAYRYPDGHIGWLVTGYAEARTVLADTRFSSRAESKRVPVHRPGAEPFIGQQPPPGWFIDLDPPEHTRFRRALMAWFTMRRIERFRSVVERVVEEHLDAIARLPQPVDLVEAFAFPVPLAVICHVLGVPNSSHELLRRHSNTLFSLESSAADGTAAMRALTELVADVVARKRRHPGDDVLSALAANLRHDEAAGAGVLLLTAGHETVASMLGLGVLTLLDRPELRDALHPDTVGAFVEELLRHLSILHLGVPRGAQQDVTVGGKLIRAGQSVTISLPAGNRDAARFPQPAVCNPQRRTAGHLAFGFGVHQCVGAHLARLELSVGYPAVFRRFPTLRLAVPVDEVPITRHGAVYGAARLPVVW
ncbi:cytochrome P450 [Dactylosporangium sp. NPDC051485]|uniref:cytochrome P450 n=1 Tax=Dactylosporangium sp. NPDC051485 TaxID=3154846 RepID=UPI003437AA9C